MKNLNKYIYTTHVWGLLTSLIALLFALILEYIFFLDPCYLCMLQRYTYSITILLCLLSLIYKYKKIISILICFSIYGTLGIAIWHFGVELHLWMPSTGCSEWDLNIGSLSEELQNNLLETTTTGCDLMSPKFLNISLVQWSLIYIIVNSIFITIFAYKQLFNDKKNEI